MARRAPKEYSEEEKLNTRVAKGEITHQQATHLRKKVRKEDEKRARGVLRRVLDFMTP